MKKTGLTRDAPRGASAINIGRMLGETNGLAEFHVKRLAFEPRFT